MSVDLPHLALRARNRAGSYWWLAQQQCPERRTLTQEECMLWAREADEFASAFQLLAAAPLSDVEGER